MSTPTRHWPWLTLGPRFPLKPHPHPTGAPMSSPTSCPPVFHLMWDLTCDAFLLDTPFTYADLEPFVHADPQLRHYAAKTRAIAWQMLTRYGVATGQMRRVAKGTYEWISNPDPELIEAYHASQTPVKDLSP